MEVEVRLRESQKVISRMAAAEGREEINRLDAEYEAWLRGRNQVRAAQKVTPPPPKSTRTVLRPRERRDNGTTRRKATVGRDGDSGDPDVADEPEPPAGGWLTFELYNRLTPFPASWRCRLFGRLPRRLQAQAWNNLEREIEAVER